MRSVIGKAFAQVLRAVVGSEFGFDNHGNTQWYYIAGIIGTIMLSFIYKPQVAIPFMVFAVLHVISVLICRSKMEKATKESKLRKIAMIYFTFHACLLVAAFFTNFFWAIITAAIMVMMYLIAPDCVGKNALWGECKSGQTKKLMVLNTIVSIALVFITLRVPVSMTVKTVILIGMLFLHYIADYAQRRGIEIHEITQNAMEAIGQNHSERSIFSDERVKPEPEEEKPRMRVRRSERFASRKDDDEPDEGVVVKFRPREQVRAKAKEPEINAEDFIKDESLKPAVNSVKDYDWLG